jgi:hypothetical protein
MSKKQNIFWFLIVLPEILAYSYSKIFEYSGNWLEDYRVHFVIIFSLVSIISCLWLVKISTKEKNISWIIFSVLLSIILISYLTLGLMYTNISI